MNFLKNILERDKYFEALRKQGADWRTYLWQNGFKWGVIATIAAVIVLEIVLYLFGIKGI